MLKKILSLAMVLCIVLPCMGVLAEGEETTSPYVKEATATELTAGIKGYYLYEDYESAVKNVEHDASLPGHANSLYRIAVDELEGADFPSTALLTCYPATLNKKYGNIYDFKEGVLPNFVMLETDFMLPNTASVGETPASDSVAQISLGASTSHTGTGVTEITMNDKGTLTVLTGNATLSNVKIMTYPIPVITPGTWHTVSIVMDTKSQRFDVYLDGIPVVLECYTSVANLSVTSLLSAILTVPYVNGTTTVAEGKMVKNGYRVTAEDVINGANVYPGNPYPVCYDNLKVAEVTNAYIQTKFENGLRKQFSDGRVYGKIVLPSYGRLARNLISVTYGLSSSEDPLMGKLSFENGRPSASGAFDPTSASVSLDITGREASDVAGEILVTYVKDVGETDDSAYDINSTFTLPVIIRANVAETEVENILANNMFFFKTDKAVSASVDVSNTGTKDYQATFFVCTYEGNRLTNITAIPTTLKAGSSEVTFFSEVPTGEDDIEVKAFMWGLKGLDPIRFGTYSLTE